MIIHSEDYLVECDVALIGGGIMSATLGVLLKELQPELSITIFERLDRLGAESSDAWNNAGTGHAALCELNYTPELPDGSINTKKALKIMESFEVSKQFWAHLVAQHDLAEPNTFINPMPHLSAVFGEKNKAFLRKRFEALQTCHLFEGMTYSEDANELAEWMPLVMHGRKPDASIAATKADFGTDVNFGNLTRSMFKWLKKQPDVNLFLSHDVYEIDHSKEYEPNAPEASTHWKIFVKDRMMGEKRVVTSKFVFIGAGGGSLPLLDKSEIEESDGFGGFPVSGQWLICQNHDLIEKHHAKVYGKAAVGAPPMSVPHLDTRIIDGKKALLFGPYAGFTTQFLKEGSFLDLPLSIDLDNIRSMFGAWWNNMDLTKYLVEQVTQSAEDRLETLREFIPDAKIEDWELATAGQRVQVIKKDAKAGGVLEFGTEVVTSADGTIAALLGASPGASVSVSVMLDLLQRCFPEQIASDAWQEKLRLMIPSFGQSLIADKALTQHVRTWTHEVLGV